MSLTAAQRQALIESESLGDWGRQALQAELERLTAIRDGLPHEGVEGDTQRNAVNAILWDVTARLAVPDPLPAADAAAVEARLAERRNRRATVTALHAELATTSPGSAAHTAIIDDLVEYGRAEPA